MRSQDPWQDAVEIANNPEPRCPCLLLLDTSGSMRGDRIKALNLGLKTLRDDLTGDSLTARRVEVAVVTFDSDVRVLQDFVAVDRFQPPRLTASGHTHMAAGIDCALELVRARTRGYRRHGLPYYRPWVFMITDGKPEGEAPVAVAHAARRLRTDEQAKRVAFFAVGVEGADILGLREIVVRTPLELDGLNFKNLFLWLSASLQSVSRSQPGDTTVQLPPLGWLKRISQYVTEHEDAIKAGLTLARVVVRVAGVPI